MEDTRTLRELTQEAIHPRKNGGGTMKIGTNHFRSLASAYAYYADYGNTRDDVDTLLRDGCIAIGPPHCVCGERLELIDNGRRYAIVDKKR